LRAKGGGGESTDYEDRFRWPSRHRRWWRCSTLVWCAAMPPSLLRGFHHRKLTAERSR